MDMDMKSGSEEYEEQLKDLRRNSMYETGILPNGQQKMVTLVTVIPIWKRMSGWQFTESVKRF